MSFMLLCLRIPYVCDQSGCNVDKNLHRITLMHIPKDTVSYSYNGCISRPHIQRH